MPRWNNEGYRGIYPRGRKFQVQIKISSKTHYLGTFETRAKAQEIFRTATENRKSARQTT